VLELDVYLWSGQSLSMSEIGIAINRGNRTAIIDNFISYSLERPKQAGKWASAKDANPRRVYEVCPCLSRR
jgi:hypothetical protein